jgi:hypothetical protein
MRQAGVIKALGNQGLGLWDRSLGSLALAKGDRLSLSVMFTAFAQEHMSTVTSAMCMYEQLELLMKPVETDVVAWRRPIILHHKPHMTWDNFFSGDDITQYAAEKGFGLTMTCRRDRLPDSKNIPGKFWHKEKTDSKARPKAARYEQPIFAIKKVGNSLIQHTSFQSTSSCNITSVNALNEISLYVKAKERGRGQGKRQWGIEMNEARELYLHTYGTIDRMDHLIQNCCMSYR